MVIWSNFIEHRLLTTRTGMFDHIALIFSVINISWDHESTTGGRTISWKILINMFRIETLRTVITRRAIWMKRNFH